MIKYGKQLDRLQKADEDTLNLIDEFTKYLFSVGVRTDKERAWAIFKTAFKIPYEMLANQNKSIEYHGQGRHLSHEKHGKQILTIKDVGRFEIKATKGGKIMLSFKPSKDVINNLNERVTVKDE